MTLDQIENAIVTQLGTQATDINIEPYPDDPKTFTLRHHKGAMLVRYDGAKFDKGKNLQFRNQTGELRFAVEIVARALRSHQGVYELLDNGRKALTGFKLQEYSKFWLSEEDFIAQESGLWYYRQIFITTGRNSEQ